MALFEHVQPATRYHYNPAGFHEFTILQGSRRAVDEYAETLIRLVNQSPTPIYILLDVSRAELPLHHLAARLRDVEKQCPQHQCIITAGVVTPTSYSLTSILEVAVSVFTRQDIRRFFTDYAEARYWLTHMMKS